MWHNKKFDGLIQSSVFYKVFVFAWKSHRLSFILANYPLFLLGTNQEDRQLELVVKHHGVNAAGSGEPGSDFIHKVSVKDEEEDAWAWSRRGGGRGAGRDIDIMGKGETQWKRYFWENPAMLSECCGFQTTGLRNSWITDDTISWQKTNQNHKSTQALGENYSLYCKTNQTDDVTWTLVFYPQVAAVTWIRTPARNRVLHRACGRPEGRRAPAALGETQSTLG